MIAAGGVVGLFGGVRIGISTRGVNFLVVCVEVGLLGVVGGGADLIGEGFIGRGLIR